MNTNLRRNFGQTILTLAATIALAALAPCAHAQNAVPLWTNRYDGAVSGTDSPTAITANSSGNVFVTGRASSHLGYPGFAGDDWATVAYSSSGVPLWTNIYNGPGDALDVPRAIATDSSGNVIVTGYSSGSFESGADYTTIKYSAAGMPLWTNRYTGLGNAGDIANLIVADVSNNVIITGWSITTNFVYDYATIKYSVTGVPLWTNRYAGGGYPSALAADGSGRVIITGSGPTLAYSSAGVLLWTNKTARTVAVDGSGNVFAAGSSGNINDLDYETIKYSSAGVPLWTNRYDSPCLNDVVVGIAVDASGNAVVTGSSSDTNGVYIHSTTIKYSSAGVALWTNYSGDSGIITLLSNGVVLVSSASQTTAYSGSGVPLWTNFYLGGFVALDASNHIFMTGQASFSGNYDWLTIKYAFSIPPPYLAITRDGSGGLFVRYTGAPDVTYRLQRAASLTGPWTDLATNTAPASGLIEYHETTPPPAQAFYRTVQP